MTLNKMKLQTITVENQCSPHVLSTKELLRIVEALNHQAIYDYNTSPWVEHGYSPPADVKLLTSGPPSHGAWNLILIDDVTVKGALGYHEDIEGGKIPVSYVAVKETREDGATPCEVASHEFLEMMVDPYVMTNVKTVKHRNQEYIVEVGDPLESCGYRAPNGQELANFVWPRWFGLVQTRHNLAQKEGYIHAPFELAPQGYISVRPVGGSEESWEQIYGYKRTSLPKWANRSK